ncbi:hypothetical protein ABT061_43335 [Streptosporangium sp. NPDC002544]|uniref:hypothetical protein n=1 Tax=Streptosporangium sp. NPDC002544 TaxID=3154538 RepID=UPI00332BCBDD
MPKRETNDADREAITAAARRLLAGEPVRSTGALNVTQLAVEAGVKRWVLTHKHQDLMAEFQQRAKEHAKLPPAFQTLETENVRLQAELRKTREEKRELEQQLKLYAMVINELSIHCQQGKASIIPLRR